MTTEAPDRIAGAPPEPSARAALGELLAALEPRLPADLVPAGSRAVMRRLTARFPCSLTRLFGFERRIDQPTGGADFLLCISPYGQERGILADHPAAARLPARLWRQPVWRRIRAFARQWTQPGSLLDARILNMWLEFDTGGAALPLPSVFFGIAPAAGGRRRRREDERVVLEAALPLLAGLPLAAAVRRMLATAVDRLPAGASLFQVGLMSGRPESGLRLCIRGLRAAEVPRYLRDIGWPGPPAALRDLLHAVAGAVPAIDLDLDVGAEVGPNVGLECPLRGWRRAQPESDFPRLLEALGRLGLCRREAGLALGRCWFFVHEHQGAVSWPPALKRASADLGGRLVSTLACGVHHVKLTCRPDAAPTAKAYLAVRHLWLQPAPAAPAARAEGSEHRP
jgi:hypothetical protein